MQIEVSSQEIYVINNRRQGNQKRQSKEGPSKYLVVKVVLRHLVETSSEHFDAARYANSTNNDVLAAAWALVILCSLWMVVEGTLFSREKLENCMRNQTKKLKTWTKTVVPKSQLPGSFLKKIRIHPYQAHTLEQ